MDKIMIMVKKEKKNLNLTYETTYLQDTPALISDFLRQNTTLSGRSLRLSFFKGIIYLNRKKAHSQAKLKNGDFIQVYSVSEERPALKPEAMLLDIIYENDDFMVINKPARLAVHPSGNITSGTLANGVAAYFNTQGLHLKVRPVNRLDYGTSGLIIFAKSAAMQTFLTKASQENRIHRIYFAVVNGIPDNKNGVINLPIGEVKGKRVVNAKGQPAETYYEVTEEFKDACLLRLNLKSGRTHQIRVHLSHIDHPIIGDPQYGTRSPLINRPALHAGRLDLSGAGLSIPELTVPFPDDFDSLLNRLRLS